MGKVAKKLAGIVLAAVMVVTLCVPAFAEDAEPAIADGTYLLKEIKSSFSMFTLKQPATVVVNGEDAVLTIETNETAVNRYDQLYIGKYADITDENKDKIGIPATVMENGLRFEIPLKTKDLLSNIYFVVRYKQGYNAQHDGDWYKASSDHYITAGPLTSTQLNVTNNNTMFKVKEAALIGTQLDVTMNSYAYDKVFVGHAELAEEASESELIKIDPETHKFQLEIADTAESILLAFHSARKDQFYSRTFTIDSEAGTLVTGDYVEPVGEVEGMTTEEAIAKKGELATVSMVNSLIRAIKVQSRNENTDKYCAVAKAYYDALSDVEKEQLIDPGYFGDDTGSAEADKAKEAERQEKAIGEKELLVVSFGTSFNDSREKTILAVENALEKAYPEYAVRRAFTAQIIINHIAAREGYTIDNMKQALDRAVAAGVKELVVQPTHLMHGAEYDEMCESLAPYQDKMNISVSEPLLNSEADKEAAAKAAVEAAVEEGGYASLEEAKNDGTAIVFMGHGTEHAANVTYTEMQKIMTDLGYENVFVGTVEGKPEGTDAHTVCGKVMKANYTKAILRPLMVVAGDHANNDMADWEDEESWVCIFGAGDKLGKENVSAQISGLGEIEAVQNLYVAHVKTVLDKVQADQSAADAVTDMITKLPNPAKASDETAVSAARKAYDALTADQKKRVTGYDSLVEAEKQVNAAKKQAETPAVTKVTPTITLAKTSVVYNGKAQTPAVTVKAGKVKLAKSSYTVKYTNNKKVGTAKVTVTLKGSYEGSAEKTFEITKAKQPMKITAKTPAVKVKKLKKAKQTIAVSKAMKITKSQGTLSYKLSSGKKYVSVNAKTGKITVKKGLKAKTYTIKIKVTAKGNANYKSGSKSVTVKIKVAK